MNKWTIITVRYSDCLEHFLTYMPSLDPSFRFDPFTKQGISYLVVEFVFIESLFYRMITSFSCADFWIVAITNGIRAS